MLVAHLSDLHCAAAADAVWLDRQLDRIAARGVDHLAITGDLLDRWDPQLLDRILDLLERRDLLQADRLTILHGNHDLASSGGHPRGGADLVRLALRFWDPPPLAARRRERFYDTISRRAPRVALRAPFLKTLTSGARVAVLDTVPLLWRPLQFEGRTVAIRHAIGCIRPAQARWLAGVTPGGAPLIVLMHHYPLGTPSFQWTPPRGSRLPIRAVRVPMHIPEPGCGVFWEAAAAARVRAVLCGHVHRARLDWHDGVAVGLNGQSGAAWAGRTIAYYDISDEEIRMQTEKT